MRKRPPQHRADAPGVFIPRTDESFDRDRYDAEIRKMREAKLPIADHPIERYYSGRTRYDLDASDLLFGQEVTARGYFSREAPEMFVLRRLGRAEFHRVMHLAEAGQVVEGQLLACRYGVAAVENSTVRLQGAESGLLTHEDMQSLFEAEQTLCSALGFAVFRFGQQLTPAEKKA